MISIKIADVAWIATALLHHERPEAQDFSRKEILKRAHEEFPEDMRPGVAAHVSFHSVASKPPQRNRIRMLHETAHGRRRLYRPGDPAHAGRTGKSHPIRDEIPAKYHYLIDWYVNEYSRGERKPEAEKRATSADTFLFFVGLIPAYDLQQMTEAISEAFEQVEAEEHEGAA